MSESELLAQIAELSVKAVELSAARLKIAQLSGQLAITKSRLFTANKRAWDYRQGYIRLKRKYEGEYVTKSAPVQKTGL